MMDYRVASRTDIGRRREQNEDSVLADLPLVAVADGMGGHSAGEVASQLAIEVLAEYRDRLSAEGSDQLVNAVQEANRRVWSKGREDTNLQGMGTTLTAVWVAPEGATVAHVGDSRAYLLRDGQLQQITEDQTVVGQMERDGKLTAEEAAVHPSRHMLLQAVGSEPQIQVDRTTFELEPGDRLMLSSDGLHGMIDDALIREILATNEDPDAACAALIDAANASGGDDNITVVIVDAVDDGAGVAGAVTRSSESAGDPTPTRPGPFIVSKPTSGPTTAQRQRRRRLAQVAIAVVAAGLIVGGLLLVMEARQGYLVTSRGGFATIVEGTKSSDGGPPDVKDVVRVYRQYPVREYARTVQRDLRAGIEVPSVEEGERTLARLPKVQGPRTTPTPIPPTPVPSPAVPVSPPPAVP